MTILMSSCTSLFNIIRTYRGKRSWRKLLFWKTKVFWEDIQKFVATFFSNKNMRLMKFLGIWKLEEMPLEQPHQLHLPKSFVGKECCDIFLDIFQKHSFFFKTTNFFETFFLDVWEWYWRVKCKKTLVLSLTVTSEIWKNLRDVSFKCEIP